VTDPSGTDRPRSTAERRAELGYRSRLERRTAKLAERRRRAATRFWAAAIPVALVIAAAVVLLVIYGGKDGGESALLKAESTSTTLTPEPVPGSALLVVEQDDSVPLVLLLHPREYGGVVLALPGMTLVKTEDGFRTLAQLCIPGGGDVGAAVSEALGVPVGPVASTEWAALRAGMIDAGIGGVAAETLASAEAAVDPLAEAAVVAEGLLGLVAAIGSEQGATVWSDLELGGDSVGFVDAVAADSSSVAGGGWSAAVIAGEMHVGAGFEYLEPDVAAATVQLTGVPAGAAITLDVQNGSGAIGVTEAAGELLSSLGYRILPYKNAPDFPDVVETRIVFAPDAAGEAEKVRDLLGVGTMSKDDTLAPGYVLVVLGADFPPPSVGGD
jgi:hypothetical protein